MKKIVSLGLFFSLLMMSGCPMIIGASNDYAVCGKTIAYSFKLLDGITAVHISTDGAAADTATLIAESLTPEAYYYTNIHGETVGQSYTILRPAPEYLVRTLSWTQDGTPLSIDIGSSIFDLTQESGSNVIRYDKLFRGDNIQIDDDSATYTKVGDDSFTLEFSYAFDTHQGTFHMDGTFKTASSDLYFAPVNCNVSASGGMSSTTTISCSNGYSVGPYPEMDPSSYDIKCEASAAPFAAEEVSYAVTGAL